MTSGSLTGPITANNSATGVVFATIGVPNSPSTPLTSSTIGNGIGNAISAQAVGASASNSITQEFANVTTVTGPGGFNPANAATNNVTTGAPLATNLANVTSIMGSETSTISAGIGNTIGASSVGAAVNVSVTQSISGSTFITSDRLGTNTADMNSNTGAVATNGQSGPAVAAQIQATMSEFGPSGISNGVGNSISASAVGASTTASINQSILGSTGNLTILGSNSVIIADHGGGVVNGADAAYNKGASPVTATFNQAGIAAIADGVGNSISAQAIGATASASISSRLDNTTTPTNSFATVQTNSVDTTAGTSAGWNDVLAAIPAW